MLTKVALSIACVVAAVAPAGYAQRARAVEAHRLLATGTSYLGVGVADIDSERAKALNLKEERGVEIKMIEPDSPAAKAGFKEGDVVLEYNGQQVEGKDQFQRLVRETPAGRQAKMTVWRGGSSQSVTATIGTRSGHGVAIFNDGEPFVMPPIPPMAPTPMIPDVPRSLMSWRSTAVGIESESLNSQLAEYFGVKEGVLVRAVTRNSAAEKAGLKAGDVIVKVDGTAVTSPREISSLVRNKHSLTVTVVRNHQEMTMNLTLDDRHGREWGPVAFEEFC